MNIYGIVGYKNSGKTGLVERLVQHITGLGLSVSTIKHAHHGFDIDQPGKDSFRHRQAGAQEVLIASGQRWVLMHETQDQAAPSLSELLTQMTPVDLVLIEGYKHDSHPKIEAHRASTGHALIVRDEPSITAVASDAPLSGLTVPVFDLDDTVGVAEFILSQLGLEP